MVTLHQQVNLVASQPRSVLHVPPMQFSPVFYLMETMLNLSVISCHVRYPISMIITRPVLPELINLLWLPRFLRFAGVDFLFRLIIEGFSICFFLCFCYCLLQIQSNDFFREIFNVRLCLHFCPYFIKTFQAIQTFMNYVNIFKIYDYFFQIFLKYLNIFSKYFLKYLDLINFYHKMFKNKSPFVPPNPQYVDKARKRTGMSIQEQKNPRLERSISKPIPMQTVQTLSVPNGIQSTPTMLQRKFCFDIAVPDVIDTSVYWQFPITSQVSNEYSRKLILRQLEYYVRNADATGIVNSIRLQIQDLPGYLSANGSQGNVIATLNLSSQTATIDDLNMKSYDLIYKQTQDVVWDIPMNLTTLKLRVYLDQNQLTGQIAPLTLQFDIRHFGR